MIIDISILEERVNTYTRLQEIAKCCLSGYEVERMFDFLYSAWELDSGDLWYLGYWNDYKDCGSIVLQVAKALGKELVEAQLLSEIGYVYMEWEEFEIAHTYFSQSIEKYKLLNEYRCECRGYRYLGTLAHRRGDYELALNNYFAALNVIEKQPFHIFDDDKWVFQKAELSNLIGNTYYKKTDFSASYYHFKLSLEQFRNMGIKWQYYQASPLLNLGKYHFHKKEYDKARDYYQECLALSKAIHRTDTHAGVLLQMAGLAEVEGNIDEATCLANESANIAGIENPSLRDRAAHFKAGLKALELFEQMEAPKQCDRVNKAFEQGALK